MALSRNDNAAAKEALLALIPRLRRFARTLAGNADDGDDLAQIALERALARLDQWQPGTRLDSWVFRIAQNAWIDEVRTRKRRGGGPVDLDSVAEIAGEDGRVVAHAQIDLAEVRAAMAALPDDQRAVLALVAIDGRSYQEAAEAMGVPIGTIMSRLSRARQAVVKRLNLKGAP